jgi:hypothetical protein
MAADGSGAGQLQEAAADQTGHSLRPLYTPMPAAQADQDDAVQTHDYGEDQQIRGIHADIAA